MFFGAVVTSGEREDHRVLALYLTEPPPGVRVVGQLVVRKHCTWNDVGAHENLSGLGQVFSWSVAYAGSEGCRICIVILVMLESWYEQRLDSAPLVHRAIPLGHLLERQLQLKTFPGLIFSCHTRSISSGR